MVVWASHPWPPIEKTHQPGHPTSQKVLLPPSYNFEGSFFTGRNAENPQTEMLRKHMTMLQKHDG